MKRKVIPVGVSRFNLIEFYHILPNRSSLEAPLQFDNYSEKFCLLLHLEEIQMEVDIHRYDMQNVSMVRDKYNKKLLVLKVSDLYLESRRNPYFVNAVEHRCSTSAPLLAILSCS